MSQKKTPASAPLRLIHALIFLGFAAATIAATHQELLQLWRSVTQPFHAGTPAAPLATSAGLTALLGAGVLLVCFALAKSAPLFVSVVMLGAFGAGFTVLSLEPKQRTAPGANLMAIDEAKVLHKRLNTMLQMTGTVPTDAQAIALGDETPYYQRGFASLPWHVELVKDTSVLPPGAQPGWLLLKSSPDRTSFIITAVGIDAEGNAALLRDKADAIEFRGAYNPDTSR